MSRIAITVGLLLAANIFMTFAKHKGWVLMVAILAPWGIAFFEYTLQVPANRLGHISQGGPFTMPQLKVI